MSGERGSVEGPGRDNRSLEHEVGRICRCGLRLPACQVWTGLGSLRGDVLGCFAVLIGDFSVLLGAAARCRSPMVEQIGMTDMLMAERRFGMNADRGIQGLQRNFQRPRLGMVAR